MKERLNKFENRKSNYDGVDTSFRNAESYNSNSQINDEDEAEEEGEKLRINRSRTLNSYSQIIDEEEEGEKLRITRSMT